MAQQESQPSQQYNQFKEGLVFQLQSDLQDMNQGTYKDEVGKIAFSGPQLKQMKNGCKTWESGVALKIEKKKECFNFPQNFTLAFWLKFDQQENFTSNYYDLFKTDNCEFIQISPKNKKLKFTNMVQMKQDCKVNMVEIDLPNDFYENRQQWNMFIVSGNLTVTNVYYVSNKKMQVIEIGHMPVSAVQAKLLSIGGFGMISEVFIWNWIFSKQQIAGFYLAGEHKFHKAVEKTVLQKQLENILNDDVTQLDYTNQNITDDQLEEIIDTVYNSMTITTLILKNTKITNKGIREHLVPFLNTLDRPFKSIDMSDCLGIQQDVEDDLMNAMPQNSAISIKTAGTDFTQSATKKLQNDGAEAVKLAKAQEAEREKTKQQVSTYMEEQEKLVEEETLDETDYSTVVTAAEEPAEFLDSTAKEEFKYGVSPVNQVTKDKILDIFEKIQKEEIPKNETKEEMMKRLKKQAVRVWDRKNNGKLQGSAQFMAHYAYIRSSNYKDLPHELKDPNFFGINYYKEQPRMVKKRKDDEIDFYTAVKKKLIEVLSIKGTCLGQNALTFQIQNNTNDSLRLVIYRGAIFQHQKWVHKQNLAVSINREIVIDGKENKTFKANAYCLNSTCACANNDTMDMTDFYIEDSEALQTQSSIWAYLNKNLQNEEEHKKKGGGGGGKKKK